MAQVYLPYIVTELFLFVFTLNIYHKLGTSFGSETETRELKYIVYSFLAVLATDIIWAWEADGVTMPGGLLTVVNGVYLCAFTAVCFFWYRFSSVRLKMEPRYRVPHWLLILPFIVFIVIIVLSLFTGWIFYIDADGTYCYGKWYFLFLVGCYFYIMLAFLRSTAAWKQATTTAKRRECLVCAAYILPPLVGHLLKPMIPTVPIMHLCMFWILQMLFLTLQENQIYNDALTGLNNRRRLNHYLEEQLPTASKKKPVSVFIMDMDGFKSINDTFGHVEGDKALIVVGRALKRAAAEFNSFVARYGGDEFCMVCVGHQYEKDFVIARLQELLTRAQKEEPDLSKRDYALTMSIGCATCSAPLRSPNQIIRLADEELQAHKQTSKSRR